MSVCGFFIIGCIVVEILLVSGVSRPRSFTKLWCSSMSKRRLWVSCCGVISIGMVVSLDGVDFSFECGLFVRGDGVHF